MSVKQDLQALKDGFTTLPPEEQRFLGQFVPFLSQHLPRVVAIVDKIPNFAGIALSIAMSAATTAGRERIAKAAKEVFSPGPKAIGALDSGEMYEIPTED